MNGYMNHGKENRKWQWGLKNGWIELFTGKRVKLGGWFGISGQGKIDLVLLQWRCQWHLFVMSDRSLCAWERVRLYLLICKIEIRLSIEIWRITYIEIGGITEMKKTINKEKEERRLESRKLHDSDATMRQSCYLHCPFKLYKNLNEACVTCPILQNRKMMPDMVQDHIRMHT